MVVSKSEISISPEEYLEGEKISPVKHEYIQGQVYAMAGASDAHNLITGSFYSFLRNHLRGKGCLPYTLDFGQFWIYPTSNLLTCQLRVSR
jgi:Uma2 family endonuclease